jgi:DNA-binding transcriptional MerR regulator
MRQISDAVFLSMEEVAHLLGVTARTIQRWIAKGENRPKHAPELTPCLFPDGKKYFRQEQIQTAYAALLGTPLSETALMQTLAAARESLSRPPLLLHREWKHETRGK